MKHTKGEWVYSEIVDEKTKKEGISIHQKGWNQGADGDDNLSSIAGIWDDSKESIANAKLIASAPNLLEALNELRLKIGNLYPRDKRFGLEYKKAMAAIKKATE